MSTFRLRSGTVFSCGSAAVALLAVVFVKLPAYAQIASNSDIAADAVGRIEFDFPGAPAATVEVDLKGGILSALTGIGQAAVQGIAEALVESGPGSGSGAVQQSAEHLKATNAILESASRVIREVRVRVYEDLAEQGAHASMVEHYQGKLDGTEWENVIRVRDENESVIVCVLQRDSAIRGLFVMVSDRDDLVLANVVCQLTPENVKQLTKQATKIGMKVGLEDVIEEAMKEIHRR